MKKLRVILSAVIAVVLAVTTLVPIIASAEVPSEQLNQMGFVAYRVLDRDKDTLPSAGETDNHKVYTVNADFADFFKGITPEAYEAGIHKDDDGDEIWITVDESGNLMIVPSTTTEFSEESMIELPVNDTVTANSSEVLAGVLLSEIQSSSARNSDAQRLAGWLKDYAENKKTTDGSWPTQDPVTLSSNVAGKISIGDLEYGYWLVYSTASVAGVSNVKVVLEVGKDSQSTIDVKAEYDGLEKTVRNSTDNDATFEKTAQADAGDILEYNVEFDIQPLSEYPTNDGTTYTDFHYVFSDTLTNQRLVNYRNTATKVEGATVKQGAFLIKVDVYNEGTRYYVDVDTNSITDAFKRSLGLEGANVQPLTNIRKEEAGAIDYGTYNADGDPHTQTFRIDFNWSSLKTLVSDNGAHVTFMYKAELMSDAVLRNPNKVTLEYSNDPNNQKSSTTHTDETVVYSFGLDITKTFDGQREDANLWKDVVFNLYEASLPSGNAPEAIVEGAKIKFIEKTTGTPGVYQRADSSDTNASYNLKLRTDDNTFSLYGLDPGYYVLEETGSPNGYLLGGKVYIYINAEGNILSVSNSALWLGITPIDAKTRNTDRDPKDETGGTYDSLQFTINNQKRNFQLPVTGDIGVWLFGIGSVMMLAVAVFVYKNIKKKSYN